MTKALRERRTGSEGPHTNVRTSVARAAQASRAALPIAAALLLSGSYACQPAPRSTAATGPVAEEVRTSLESGTASFDHGEWSRLLAGGTDDGLVDYPHFQDRRATLEAYLGRVAEADLPALAPAELEALLINAYNALALRTILEHPSVASIRDIDGVFDEIEHRVGGHDLTLDEIEHNLLRPFFRDPRIHFVVNCASISCAPLPPWAFDGDSLEAQLERRTRAFLRDSTNVRVEDGTLFLSQYFEWYGNDFTRPNWEPSAATIADFVAMYATEPVRELVVEHQGEPPIRFLTYDWSLNASRPPDPGRSGGDGEGAANAAAGSDRGADGARAADEGWAADVREWVAGFGAAAPALYGIVYVVAVVAFVPGAPLTIGAGVAFGLLWGTILVSIASVIGAALAFLIARHLMRERVERWIESREKLAAVDRAVESEGWKVVGLTRLSPLFPFNVQNYFYGLTGVEFWPYVLVSWVAMLPGTLLYVYIGAAGVGIAQAATGGADWGRTVLQVGGLLATLTVVVLVTRVARRELNELTGARQTG